MFLVFSMFQLSPYLASEVHNSQSGRFIATKLVELAMSHFNLSSTTVTGIPMKVIEQLLLDFFIIAL